MEGNIPTSDYDRDRKIEELYEITDALLKRVKTLEDKNGK